MIRVLPFSSKVYEQIIYKGLSEPMDTFLRKLISGFKEDYSIQHALFKQV